MDFTIPTGRTVISGWSAGVTVGVVGGISQFDSRTVYEVTGLTLDGVTDCRPAIQSVIDSVPEHSIVQLPSGNIKLNGILNFGVLGQRHNITLKGSIDQYGRPTTKIYPSNIAVQIGTDSDFSWSYPPGITAINSPLAGSTKITLSDASLFSNNKIIRISRQNNTGIPVISTEGYDGIQSQETFISNKVGNTFDIDPPLYWDLPSGSIPTVRLAQFISYFNGVENLDIIATGSSALQGAILMVQSYSCWIKNVKISGFTNTAIGINDSVRCEVRKCQYSVPDPSIGTNKHGILLNGVCSACLFEDNISINIAPGIQLFGPSCGNVFAYNLIFAGAYALNIHNSHPCFNLYEGNYATQYHADGFFGSASHETLYRNWFHGQQTPTGIASYTSSFNRFLTTVNIVGNVFGSTDIANGGYSFGNPNIGNSNFSGYVSFNNGPKWFDLNPTTNQARFWSGRLIARGDPSSPSYYNSGVISGLSVEDSLSIQSHTERSIASSYGTVNLQYFSGIINFITISSISSGGNTGIISFWNSSQEVPVPTGQLVYMYPSPGGFQESDLDVSGTSLIISNYLVPNGIGATENLNGSGLAPSLFRQSKPDYFGPLDWPPVNPILGQPSSFQSIPAGYRYFNDGMDPSSGSSPSGPTFFLGRSQFVRQQIMLMSRRR